jgi:peptidoglycan/xylan/chitin deacetylase (PgdA/CDA1 family)
LTGQNILLPFYHAVSDSMPLHLKYLYQPRAVEQFKKDLDYFLSYYEPIELDDLIQLRREKKAIKKNVVHLTFDDGLSNFYDTVAPILKEKGIPATVFLNSDFIDNKELFYRFKASILIESIYANGLLDVSYSNKKTLDELAEENGVDFNKYLKNEKPYMDSNQIKNLIQQGFTFGAHSLDHPLYNQISIEDQISQTLQSVDDIASMFSLDYKVFSFPFTDNGVSKQFFKEIESKIDITFGCAGLKKDAAKYNYQRIPMEVEGAAKELIKSEYFYYLLKSFVGKNRISRQ